MNFGCNEFQSNDGDVLVDYDYNGNLSMGPEQSLSFDDLVIEDWTKNSSLEDNTTFDLDSFAFLLNSEEWGWQEPRVLHLSLNE